MAAHKIVFIHNFPMTSHNFQNTFDIQKNFQALTIASVFFNALYFL